MGDPFDILQKLYKTPYCKALAMTCQQYHGYADPSAIEANCLKTVDNYELSTFKVMLETKGVTPNLLDGLFGKGEVVKKCRDNDKPPSSKPGKPVAKDLPKEVAVGEKKTVARPSRSEHDLSGVLVASGLAILAFGTYVAATLLGVAMPKPVAASIVGGQTYQGISPDGNYL